MKHFIAVAFFVFCYAGVQAQTTEYFSPGGVAINGYDPVAYFIESLPVKGTKEWSYKWNGTQWYFKNAANRETFKANPVKYAPQFGGYCAYGVSENHKSPTEPDAFTVAHGRLYFNYNKNVQQLWLNDTVNYIPKADANWSNLKNK
jgi:YHS domain-containing protein